MTFLNDIIIIIIYYIIMILLLEEKKILLPKRNFYFKNRFRKTYLLSKSTRVGVGLVKMRNHRVISNMETHPPAMAGKREDPRGGGHLGRQFNIQMRVSRTSRSRLGQWPHIGSFPTGNETHTDRKRADNTNLNATPSWSQWRRCRNRNDIYKLFLDFQRLL